MIPDSVSKMVRELDHPAVGDAERKTILKVLSAGEDYGYGNMMAWLAMAWAVKLRDQGMSEKAAIDAVSNRTPYRLPK